MPSGWSDSSTERFSGWDIIPTQVPKYIHNLYFLIAEPTEEQYLPIQVLDTLADPSANLT